MKDKNILLLALLALSAQLFCGTPRVLTQKVACTEPNQVLDYVTNTGVTTSASYTVRADILETENEELGTDLGTAATYLRIYKAGNGTTVPYYAAISVQLGQFDTQWAAGNTLRLTVTYLPTSETSTPWDITIPTGSATVTILDPVMTVPPNPITELSPPVLAIQINEPNVNLTWAAVSGATSYSIYSSSDPYGGYTMVASTSNNAYSLSIVGDKYFYKAAATRGRVESNPSDVVGYMKYPCVVGDNFVAMPLVQSFVYTSEFGAQFEDSINTINIWNPTSQAWDASVNYGDGFWDPELPIGTGSVLFFNTASPLNYYSNGTMPATNAQYQIVVGDNTVMIPLNQSALSTTASVGLSMGDGETVNTINLWNSGSQAWDASVNYGGGFWDPELATQIGTPLFLNSATPESWPTIRRSGSPRLEVNE